MNCDQDLVLAFIEEDNIQRAYFRVKPLLTIHGDVQEEAMRLWPDHGCLRIVPDRNEQHTFKDRMRSMGNYCIVNLVGIPADANKIRTNKNYKPERGEFNQFILYSDTVHALPEHTFFEVLTGSAQDYATLAKAAITPLFYIQENDTIYGPVKKAEPSLPSPAAEAAGVLYPLSCPDAIQRTILCMETPAEALPKPVVTNEQAPISPKADPPAKEEKPLPAEAEALPIGEELHILDERKDFKETLDAIAQPLSAGANLLRDEPKKPSVLRDMPKHFSDKLSGTPLMKTDLRTSTPQPKNKLQEVVCAQLRVGRYEPPADELPSGVAMQPLVNPVEQACQYVRQVWQTADFRPQMVDFLLSLDGMRARLDSLTDTCGSTPLQRVLHQRLNDLETERLTALVHLDKAKADLDAFRKETLAGMSARTKADLEALTASKTDLEASLTTLKEQQAALAAQRDELLAQVDQIRNNDLPESLGKAMADASLIAPVYGIPLRMTPVSGIPASLDEMIERVVRITGEGDQEISRNAAIAFLLLLAVCPQAGIYAPAMGPASTMVGNMIRALGWASSYAVQVSAEQKPVSCARPVDSTPCICLSTVDCHAPLTGMHRLYITSNMEDQTQNGAYKLNAWPVYPLFLSTFVAEKISDAAPISEASLTALLAHSSVKNEEIDAALANILKAVPPMSAASDKAMRQFIACAADMMDGGFPAACDWAMVLWLVPRVTDKANFLALLDEYPLTRTYLA